jgi:light-regulated signal transduction histidine kinase (bacteriophytochrome)
VRERTAQLEAANRELEAFSYSVAHDLRAPLRAVDGYSSMLQEDFGQAWPAEAQRLLGSVRTSAQHMGRLIDDLLRLSRLGRQPLSAERVPVAALARQVLDELRAAQPERRLDAVVADVPDAVGDVALLRQVLVNLLANAVKFTRGRARATIEVGCRDDAHERVYFVRDNGAGFDMAFAGRLFGVFQRQHRADEFEGTGVGLSIVQRIIHRHGGRVWAEAAVDQGATFFFTLPPRPAEPPVPG